MLRQSLVFSFLILLSNNLFCQNFELDDRFKDLLKETAKNEVMYNYMLFSIELNWKKENQLITDAEFDAFRSIEMENLGFKKTIPFDAGSRQTAFNLLESDAAEPFIAIDPIDSSRLVAAAINNISNQPYNSSIFFSSDAGASWNQSNFDPLTAALTTIANPNIVYGISDPVLTIDNNGTVHLVYLTAHEPAGGGFVIGTFYVYSNDGGQNFVIPPLSDFVVTSGAAFTGSPLDRIWLDTDNTGGPNDGTVYLSGFLFSMPLGVVGQAVFVKSPLATGFNQGPFAAVPGTAQSGNIRVDKHGTLHLSCSRATPAGGPREIVYTRSIDQGQTWDVPLVLDSGKHYLNIGEISQIHSRENCAPSLTVAGNNVYLAWSKLDNSEIRSFYAYSQNGGSNWSAIQEFGPILVPGPYFHLMPCIAASGEKCSVAWFVVDSVSLQGEYYLAELLDKGQTYGSAQIISSGPTDFSTTGQTTFYGDYNTIIRDSCIIYSIWADGQVLSPTTYVVRTNTCDSIVTLSEFTPLYAGFRIESLYPNPVVDKIIVNLSIPKKSNLDIDIFDVRGRLIKNQKFNSVKGVQTITIQVGDLSSGSYLLKVSQANGVFNSRKFFKE